MVSVVLGVAWLDAAGGHGFYVLVLTVFFVELAALAGVAVFATWRVLLRS